MTDTMTIRELQDYLNGRAVVMVAAPAEYARASAAYFAVDRLLAEREELVGALNLARMSLVEQTAKGRRETADHLTALLARLGGGA